MHEGAGTLSSIDVRENLDGEGRGGVRRSGLQLLGSVPLLAKIRYEIYPLASDMCMFIYL